MCQADRLRYTEVDPPDSQSIGRGASFIPYLSKILPSGHAALSICTRVMSLHFPYCYNHSIIDWIGFNRHSTALVILGRPRGRGRIHRKSTFEFLWSLTCPEDRLWYTGPTDVAKEKCLAKGRNRYTAVAAPSRLEPRTSRFTVQCAIHYTNRSSQ